MASVEQQCGHWRLYGTSMNRGCTAQSQGHENGRLLKICALEQPLCTLGAASSRMNDSGPEILKEQGGACPRSLWGRGCTLGCSCWDSRMPQMEVLELASNSRTFRPPSLSPCELAP